MVSAQDAKTLDIVAAVYGSVVTAGIHRAPSIKVAEAAKVIENTQRDLNIAFMNELSAIFHAPARLQRPSSPGVALLRRHRKFLEASVRERGRELQVLLLEPGRGVRAVADRAFNALASGPPRLAPCHHDLRPS